MMILDMPRQVAARGLHLAAEVAGSLALVESPVVVQTVPRRKAFATLAAAKLFLRRAVSTTVPICS